MAEEGVSLPEQVSAQEYMMNLMVDPDDDDDVRLHLTALCGDSQGLRQALASPESSQWLNYRVRPYLSPPLRLAVSGELLSVCSIIYIYKRVISCRFC